ASLRRADPDGYQHLVKLHEGRGHWMHRDERPAVDWMARFTRNTVPERIVWMQSPVTHHRFYWLAVPEGSANGGGLVIAERKGQRVEIEKAEGVEELIVRFSDAMDGLDLDREVVIAAKGRTLFKGV